MRIGLMFDSYFDKFSKRDLKPTSVAKLLWKLRSTISKSWGKKSNLSRFLFMQSQIPDSPILNYSNSSVEILYVAKAEDIQLLHYSVSKSIKNTINEIKCITIIVPDSDQSRVKDSLGQIQFQINVIPESLLVDSDVVELIKLKKPDRFGWILQQVLVAQYILNSNSKNILVVDADTIILNPQVWVGDDGRQILLPTYELHPPYYDFFQLKSTKYPVPQFSFVSHHMLIQTHIFKEVFGIWNGSVRKALIEALDYAAVGENSPFDLKYEIYAQYLIKNYPQLIKFVKWANLSKSAADFPSILGSEKRIVELRKDYNSISFHHWNTA
jgi:hypothetical protein